MFFCCRNNAVVFRVLKTAAVVGKVNSTVRHFNQFWTDLDDGGNVENILGNAPACGRTATSSPHFRKFMV